MNRFVLALALVLLGTQPALAQETFSFQGRLTGPDGAPVADGSYGIQFQLFDAPTGGSPLWAEGHSVTTSGGVFSVVLGMKATLKLDTFEDTPQLQLIVDGAALSPRTPLTAVPYAMKSYRLDADALRAGQNVEINRLSDGTLQIGSTGGSGSGLSSVATDATIEGNGTSGAPLGLADGSVTGAKLSNNALLAGANVDIVRRGNGSLEISAMGGGGGGLTQVASDATLAGNGTAGSPLQLADGAVTGAKLADGALVAGTNVTITRQAGGAFEVASTGGGLAQVTSNATLTGEGTAGAPLQVSVPLVLTNPGNGTVLEAHNGTGTTGHLGSSDAGAYGEHSQGHRGLLGGEFSGVFGLHGNGNTGDLGSSNYGAYGFSNTAAGVYGGHNSGTIGTLGSGNHGVYGEHGNGHFGLLGSNDLGILGGHSSGNIGMLGSSDYGAYGFSNNTAGVYGEHNSGNSGHLGSSDYGAYGRHSNGNAGYLGGVNYGAQGTRGTNNGILGASDTGVFGQAQGSNWAGYFSGHAHVTQNFSVGGTKNFKIDHPLDPAGKYLNHFSIESDEVLNVYSGTVHLNAQGEANVVLPAWMEALNINFRYQLTAIGAPGPNLYIAEELSDNQFKIAGGLPGMKVSWQVTGVRNDPAVQALKPAVEEEKPPRERGYYVHPQFYGQPQERSILWARDPELMRELQAVPVRPHVERPQRAVEQARLEAERLQKEEQRQR
jgi:hypothetical protein